MMALAGLAVWCAGQADDKPPRPTPPATDAELLEFLGSVDDGADSQAADDGSWIDYLSQADIARVARSGDPSRGPRAKQDAVPPTSTAPGDKKDD
jgi:hypothetical protein